MPRCIWLDSGVRKACPVLKARLEPLGYRVLCSSWSHDRTMIAAAKMWGCIIVSTDATPEPTDHGRPDIWVYIPVETVKEKSARDLATLIIKKVLGR